MIEALLKIRNLIFDVVLPLGLMQILHQCFGEVSGITSEHECP